MNLSKYLAEVGHAVDAVMREVHTEQEHLRRLQTELSELTAQTEDGYRRVEFLALNPDLDDEGLGTAMHWDTYFGPDKERYHKQREVGDVEGRIQAREFSVSALSGNLLQYAKQGLSVQFGKHRDGCPEGRNVHGLPLHEVIWQARNQALHWEEGNPHPPVVRCFAALAQNADAKFADFRNRSMAYDVICLLGWYSTDNFMRDMNLFIRPVVAAGGTT